MTSVMMQMKAYLSVSVGMRVIYDCPPAITGDDWQSREFFGKYKGCKGTIVGFSTTYVSILDRFGRLPGTYYLPGYVDMQFDDDGLVQRGLNTKFVVLVDNAQTASFEGSLVHQYVGDLPYPIQFYPGDTVHKSNDLLKIERLVDRVDFDAEDERVPKYFLAETEEIKKLREKDKETAWNEGKFPNPAFSVIESLFDTELELVSRGNLYWLYIDASKMDFATPEDAVKFWAQDGLSYATIVGESHREPVYECSHTMALAMLGRGEGELIISLQQTSRVRFTSVHGTYRVHRLHDCFASHREYVRALSLIMEESQMAESSG